MKKYKIYYYISLVSAIIGVELPLSLAFGYNSYLSNGLNYVLTVSGVFEYFDNDRALFISLIFAIIGFIFAIINLRANKKSVNVFENNLSTEDKSIIISNLILLFSLLSIFSFGWLIISMMGANFIF